jgi:large subunit ribosomal protein L25
MEDILLEVEIRKEIGTGKVKALRGSGFIPAVIYAQGKESKVIKTGRKHFLQLMHQHHLENAVLNIKIKDSQKAEVRPCLIKEMQHDPVSGELVHIDFQEISLTKAIKVNVPVVAKGEAVGVKQEGGSLEHILWEIEVECLPMDIPKEISVDVTNLKMGEGIHIKDIVFPEKIKVLSDPTAVVFSVVAPLAEEAPVEALEGEESKEPEVIKEKKEVPGGEGAKKEDKE